MKNVSKDVRKVYHKQHKKRVDDKKSMDRFIEIYTTKFFKIPENYFQHRNGWNARPASTARACRIQNSCMHDLNSEI